MEDCVIYHGAICECAHARAARADGVKDAFTTCECRQAVLTATDARRCAFYKTAARSLIHREYK